MSTVLYIFVKCLESISPSTAEKTCPLWAQRSASPAARWLMYEPIVLSKNDEGTKLPLVALLCASAPPRPNEPWPLNMYFCAVRSTMVGRVALATARF